MTASPTLKISKISWQQQADGLAHVEHANFLLEVQPCAIRPFDVAASDDARLDVGDVGRVDPGFGNLVRRVRSHAGAPAL